jgi:CarboxypepD_reg-like domain
MTSNEKARFNAYTLSLVHLAENISIIKEVPALEQAITAASQLLENIEAINSRRAEKLTGAASKKQQYRVELSRSAMAIASIIGGYAADRRDPELKEAMTFSFSELRYAGDSRLNEYCINILSRARGLGAALEAYGINEGMLKEFENLKQLYNDNKTQPRNLLAERKDARQQVKELLRELNSIFVDKLDTMLLLFKTSHREFYGQYLVKRTIINPGHRSTRVEGRVMDKASLAELAKVKVTVQGTGLTAITNEDGTYIIKTPVLPSVMVVFEKEGYKTVSAEVPVKRGQASAQDISLESDR